MSGRGAVFGVSQTVAGWCGVTLLRVDVGAAAPGAGWCRCSTFGRLGGGACFRGRGRGRLLSPVGVLAGWHVLSS
jgi:hypothetical protein